MIKFDEMFETIDTVKPDRPRLSNTMSPEGGKREKAPRELLEILKEVRVETSATLGAVAGTLFAIHEDKVVRQFQKVSQFFAWLHKYFGVYWDQQFHSKKEFFDFSIAEVEQFDTISAYPHFPPIEGVLYTCKEAKPTTTPATPKLDKLISYFSPATEVDRILIRAFLLTLLWGGPPGQRPSFVITSVRGAKGYGIGVGKTSLVQTLSQLVGGETMTSLAEKNENLKKRILSPGSIEEITRVVLIDNAKSRKLSLQDFESLVTSKTISGHKMWTGGDSIPNHFTYVVTINDANLSRDLASRSVVIHLKDSVKDPTWITNVENFIQKHRDTLYSEINFLLTVKGTEPLPKEGGTRWALWERDVLAKLEQPESVRKEVVKRQEQYDVDRFQQQDFLNFVCENLNVHYVKKVMKSIAVIPLFTMTKLYEEYTGETASRNTISSKIESLGIPEIFVYRKEGRKVHFFVHTKGEALNTDLAEKAYEAALKEDSLPSPEVATHGPQG